ncbi:hypothetical protein BZM27_00240 [Paraburkholderia steynii]|uniref:CN hydrolase domain-containing protein n=1 Tax=Paraburkholderia steynii TaxID=1245441 RepID=A0A4R0XPB5_9BURK|nr:hypothetical protein BZM27_00240 [Paraburkholderia steynii]
MGKVLVGLWSRDTHAKRNFSHETLIPLGKAVSATKEMAATLSSKVADGMLSSIFVAPEFLFTQPRKDNTGTTAMTTLRRDWILEKIKSMASTCPGMLLIPGTIVFKERITSETVAEAIKSVQQAISPVRTTVAGVKSRNIPIKPYMTYEASDKTTTASKAHYEQSLEELSLFEKNKIISGSGGMKHSLLINNRTYVFFDRQRIFSYGKKSNMGDYFEDSEKGIYVPGREDGFTEIGKLKVGFEVCLDHSLGMLKEHMQAADLDLHVIASAEVPNNASNCATKVGGFTIHASANPDFSGVFKKVTGMGTQPMTVYKFEKNKDATVKTEETVRGWDNVAPEKKEVEIDGGPLRFYVIDLPD